MESAWRSSSIREPREKVPDGVIEREPGKWQDGVERTKASVRGCSTSIRERRTIDRTFEIDGVD